MTGRDVLLNNTEKVEELQFTPRPQYDASGKLMKSFRCNTKLMEKLDVQAIP